MIEFKKVLCVRGNWILRPRLKYYYTVGNTWYLDNEPAPVNTKVFHIYAAENSDAWILDLTEKDFNETFKRNK